MGGAIPLQAVVNLPGSYSAGLPASSISASGGSFTFRGLDGTQVGSFTASVNFPAPLISWTNQSAAANVTRASGVAVNWDGGAPGTVVYINGSSSGSGVIGVFSCVAPAEAKTFSVPAYILLAIPAGTGTMSIQNNSNFTNFTFSPAGIDYASGYAALGIIVNSTFN